jgi:hypothetical protein
MYFTLLSLASEVVKLFSLRYEEEMSEEHGIKTYFPSLFR